MSKNKILEFLNINKKLVIAFLALLEACLLICAATFSWIEGSNHAKVETDASAVTAGAGLSFTDLDGNGISTVILPGVNLQDCSSVDGRNMFFPTTTTFSNTTSSMTFREGVDADVNTKYIMKEFYMSAYAGSKVYIDNSSSVTGMTTDQLKALRISINFNDGSTPILLCPGVQWTGYTESDNAVASIAEDGVASTSRTTAYPLAYYSYNNNKPVAELASGATKRVTVSVWLEGTDPNAIQSNYNTSALNISLKLTTARDYTKNVKFVDYSPNRWVDDKASDGVSDCYMFAIDMGDAKGSTNYSSGVAYMLKKQSDGITYTAMIPETVGDVIFARYDPTNSSNSYNVWGNYKTVSMSDSATNTYYAIGQGHLMDKANYGYWVKSGHEGVVDLYYTDACEAEIQLYVGSMWAHPFAYFFNDGGSVGPAFPGVAMTKKSGTNNWCAKIPSGATKVIFSNCTADGKTVYSQTGNINISTVGYTLVNNGNNNWSVTTWGDSVVANIFNDSSSSPNLYFTSSTYGSALAKCTGGVFNPTAAFNKSTNYGFNMRYCGTNDNNQRVFHMILPHDAVVKFNGYDHESANLTPGTSATTFNMYGYYFTTPTNYGTWTPDPSVWPKQD